MGCGAGSEDPMGLSQALADYQAAEKLYKEEKDKKDCISRAEKGTHDPPSHHMSLVPASHTLCCDVL